MKKEIQKMLAHIGADEFLKGSKWKWSNITGDCYCLLPDEQYEKHLLPILKKYELVIEDIHSWLCIEYRADEDEVVYILELEYGTFFITNVMLNSKLDAKVKELAMAERSNA